jgi:hypothetical protein
MLILNGRSTSDNWGNCTHHNKSEGHSTTDLAIASDFLMPLMSDFQVLPQLEISDHCKIVAKIKNQKQRITFGSKWGLNIYGIKIQKFLLTKL